MLNLTFQVNLGINHLPYLVVDHNSNGGEPFDVKATSFEVKAVERRLSRWDCSDSQADEWCKWLKTRLAFKDTGYNGTSPCPAQRLLGTLTSIELAAFQKYLKTRC